MGVGAEEINSSILLPFNNREKHLTEDIQNDHHLPRLFLTFSCSQKSQPWVNQTINRVILTTATWGPLWSGIIGIFHLRGLGRLRLNVTLPFYRWVNWGSEWFSALSRTMYAARMEHECGSGFSGFHCTHCPGRGQSGHFYSTESGGPFFCIGTGKPRRKDLLSGIFSHIQL